MYEDCCGNELKWQGWFILVKSKKKFKIVLYDGVVWRYYQLYGDIVEIDVKESQRWLFI